MAIAMETPPEMGEGYGLSTQEITPELAKYLSLESNRGVMVSAVRPGSRAEKDGIQPGDIFVEINGRPITDLKAVTDLIEKGKDPLEAKIARGKQILKITLNLE
jgi:serine protease Do